MIFRIFVLMSFIQIRTVEHELSTKRLNTQSIISLEPYETGTRIKFSGGAVLKIVEDIENVMKEINSGEPLIIFNEMKDGLDPEFEFI